MSATKVALSCLLRCSADDAVEDERSGSVVAAVGLRRRAISTRASILRREKYRHIGALGESCSSEVVDGGLI